MRDADLFPHQFDAPIINGCKTPINFSIATQIPRINNFSLSDRNTFPFIMENHRPLYSTKLAVTNLFATFLRLTAAPCTDRCTLSTFTHNAYNVMRCRKPLLRHSIKHYKAMDNLSKTFISFGKFDFHLQNYIFSLKQQTNNKFNYGYIQ